jgi:hypothetical protein
LRGLSGGKCPECGREFDLSDPHSFAKRPPRRWIWRWTRRIFLFSFCAALGVASVPGWYWWQWRSEQRLIDRLEHLGGRIRIKRVDAEGFEKYLPQRWAFLRDHAQEVRIHRLSKEQIESVDLSLLRHTKWFEAWDCHLDDKVLGQFANFKKLEHLNVFENPLNGSGLEHLAGCPLLSELDLRGTHVNDAALAHIAGLKSLRILVLKSTAVTDGGMEELAKLPSLQLLDLEGTAVSDAGLKKLAGCLSLRWIRVENTRVTPNGKDQLKASLPSLVFYQ